MRSLSGLLLDPYDDPQRELLSQLYPDGAPSLLKEARDLSEVLDRQPDHLFALCMRQGEVGLRKFAMTDPGNTALSALYFLERGHLLPEQAQKLAAERLLEGCRWYGLDAGEELQKVAFMGALKSLGNGALSVGRKLGGGAVSLGKSVASNPMGALGKGMAAMGAVGTAKSVAGNMGQATAAGGTILPLGSIGG